MNKSAFLTKLGLMERGEDTATAVASNAKQKESRISYAVERRRGLPQDKSFSLVIRSDDGRTLLESRAKYLHQAFQSLIDWSIGHESHDGCAAISGPNGFYTNHRIKASRDFAWIEGD
jgi:hypothetical protein